MGLFKRFRRSPEERAWRAIRELESTLKAKDSATRPAARPADFRERWRPFLTQLFVGLALLFIVLLAARYVTRRLRPPDPFGEMNQQTFDLLWGAQRPGAGPNTTEPDTARPADKTVLPP